MTGALLSDRKLTLANHLREDFGLELIVALTELTHAMSEFKKENPLYDKNEPYCLERAYSKLRDSYSKVK